MDAKSIREYAKIMKDMELTALEINIQDENKSVITNVKLERKIKQVIQAPTAAITAAAAVPTAISMQQQSSGRTEEVTESKQPVTADVKSKSAGFVEITSPMVGVFYTSPSENAKPYVAVGDTVKKGDVLCIIEAMKLMNEITAEEDGVIEEVCVSNGQVVDFGHILFKMSK